MEVSKELKTSVVVTRLGNFWVTSEKAKSISTGLDDKQGKVVIENIGVIAMNQIYAVLTKEGYDTYQLKESGKWQCEKGTWHEKFSKCDCRNETYRTIDELPIAKDNRDTTGEGYKKFQETRAKMIKKM